MNYFCLVLITLTAWPCIAHAENSKRPNILLIAIDDMNDWVGCLNGHPNAKSPNLDQLAKRGTLFTNAHCQAPICNPSRTSIMYGIRPSTSGVYMNAPKPWTVAGMRDRATLPRHFAANGYSTYTAGKIYHGSGLPPDDFDHVGPRPGQRQKIDERLIPPTPDGAHGLWDFGGQAYAEEKFQDHVTATWAIDQISKHSADDPFLMAIGFYRPHVPFYAPTRVLNQIPLNEITLPEVKLDDRDDLPPIVDQLTIAPAAPPHRWFVEANQWKPAVQAYLACIRWTDEQVGRLLEAIDQSPHAENTIIMLYSDHGFFLGEKQRWAKQSLWERATHVPFIIDAPNMPNGQRCDQPVELLSIYPTLIDLTGVSKRDDLDGTILTPLLKDASTVWNHVALTTHGKDNHSVRTKTHRYIRYRDGSEELYDLTSDPNEWNNLAGQTKYDSLKQKMAERLPELNATEAKASGRR